MGFIGTGADAIQVYRLGVGIFLVLVFLDLVRVMNAVHPYVPSISTASIIEICTNGNHVAIGTNRDGIA